MSYFRKSNEIFLTAHWNAKYYFQFYVSQIQEEIQAKEQLELCIEVNGEFPMAKVVKVDRILALLHFEGLKRFEWIYVGSPRIGQIFRNCITKKKLDNIIQFKTYSACRTEDVILVESFEKQNDRNDEDASAVTAMLDSKSIMNQRHDHATEREHSCSHECVRSEDNVELERVSLFRRPILCGWEHNSLYYRTPCDLHLYSYSEIEEYLVETKSKLRIDCFELSQNFDPSKYERHTNEIAVSFFCYHYFTPITVSIFSWPTVFLVYSI